MSDPRPDAAAGITILGLDPGTRHFGWGVVRRVGTRLTHVAHGVVSVVGEGPLGERLVAIEAALVLVVAKYAPLEARMHAASGSSSPRVPASRCSNTRRRA